MGPPEPASEELAFFRRLAGGRRASESGTQRAQRGCQCPAAVAGPPNRSPSQSESMPVAGKGAHHDDDGHWHDRPAAASAQPPPGRPGRRRSRVPVFGDHDAAAAGHWQGQALAPPGPAAGSPGPGVGAALAGARLKSPAAPRRHARDSERAPPSPASCAILGGDSEATVTRSRSPGRGPAGPGRTLARGRRRRGSAATDSEARVSKYSASRTYRAAPAFCARASELTRSLSANMHAASASASASASGWGAPASESGSGPESFEPAGPGHWQRGADAT